MERMHTIYDAAAGKAGPPTHAQAQAQAQRDVQRTWLMGAGPPSRVGAPCYCEPAGWPSAAGWPGVRPREASGTWPC